MIEEDSSISYDLSDISKENAKYMEKIHKVFDGSKRKVSSGFCFHGVGFQDFLLKFEAHKFGEKYLNQTRKKIVFNISKQIKGKGIWLFDRGNDHKKFFKDLSKKGIRFICRIKKNRLVVLKKSGKICKVENLKPGKYEVYLLNEHNNKVEGEAVFTLVVHNHLEEKKEICLLSNLPFSKYSEPQFVQKYLERWEIEKSFKRLKTKFNLEKIRVMTFKRFVNLISLIRLAQGISTLLFYKIRNLDITISLQVFNFTSKLKIFLKRKYLDLNLESFLSFLGTYFSPFLKRKLPFSSNLSLFSHYALEKLSLFIQIINMYI